MLYQCTNFKVEIDGLQSEWKHQATGIRQGCPLSPYLFLLVMTVLMHDIKEHKATRENLEDKRIQEPFSTKSCLQTTQQLSQNIQNRGAQARTNLTRYPNLNLIGVSVGVWVGGGRV